MEAGLIQDLASTMYMYVSVDENDACLI